MPPTSISRRQLLRSGLHSLPALLVPLALLPSSAWADDTLNRALNRLGGRRGRDTLSPSDASGGIKEALAQGVDRSIRQLGRPDGFFRDQAVKILMPERLRQIADLARRAGAGSRVDAFEESMNRAAEKAVPAAASILGDAVRGMTVQDAVGLVRGGETSATDFFRRSSGERLFTAFRPIVVGQTQSAGVTRKYKAFSDRVGGSALGGLLTGNASGNTGIDLDDYVTEKAIDGLFYVIAGQEKQIRSNPAARSTDLLRRVFG